MLPEYLNRPQCRRFLLLLLTIPGISTADLIPTPPKPLPAAFWLYLAQYSDADGRIFNPQDLALLLSIPPPGVAVPDAHSVPPKSSDSEKEPKS